MVQKLKAYIKNRSLLLKINIIITAVTVGSVMLMMIMAYFLSQNLTFKNQKISMHTGIGNASQVLDNYTVGLVDQFINICGTKRFVEITKSIIEKPDEAMRHSAQLQSVLSSLSHSNYLIDSVMILSGRGDPAYYLWYTPIYEKPDQLLTTEERKNIRNITWLPERKNPFSTSTAVIPFVIPIRMSGSFLYIVNQPEETPALFIVFYLNKDKILDMIRSSIVQSDVTKINLVNQNAILLSQDPDMPDFEGKTAVIANLMAAHMNALSMNDLNKTDLSEDTVYAGTRTDNDISGESDTIDSRAMDLRTQKSAETSFVNIQNRITASQHTINGITQREVFYEDHDQYLILDALRYRGLYLLMETDRQSFSEFLPQLAPTTISVFVFLLIFLLVVSLFFTRYITKPLVELVDVVNQIRSNTYTGKKEFKTKDEVGTLLNAINLMYDTNQKQMKRIREDEKERYHDELKLLTEQINPHFLYNTLEEIQSEVLRNDKMTAAAMIQSLASYLRIGLSGGADQITIADEIRHAASYVDIMKHRFDQDIMFIHRVDPGLEDQKILKTILQPLLENSIRHGFGIDANGVPVSVPTLEVNFSSPEPHEIDVEIMDNGAGFDTTEVRHIMTSPIRGDVRTHVGINNTWLRLVSFYGEENVSVKIESIPYYRNGFLFSIKHAF